MFKINESLKQMRGDLYTTNIRFIHENYVFGLFYRHFGNEMHMIQQETVVNWLDSRYLGLISKIDNDSVSIIKNIQ